MAISSTALMAASMAMTAASTVMGVSSSIQQANAQREQANYQAKVAEQNQNLAEQQASAERKAGYDNMIQQRQETARLIGKQRAAMGASGAAVDVGSNLDLQADTAYRGEIDAVNAYQQGIDRAYNAEIQATNYANQAAGFRAQGDYAQQAGITNAIATGIGGIAQMGTTWAKFKTLPTSTPAADNRTILNPSNSALARLNVGRGH